MASLAQIMSISSCQNAVWRECLGCTDLAPLAPDETCCKACKAAPETLPARRRPARAA